MMKSKAITAGAIALTLTLGGGGIWMSQYVNAATAADTQSTQAAQAEDSTSKKDFAGKRGGFGHGFNQIQDELLAYLGLDEAALQTKLETLTLAEIAVEQGKTREELKAKLVEWLEAAQAEAGVTADVDAAAKAEKLLDSKGFGFGKHGGRGGHGWGGNIDAIAEALGLTADELKAEIEEGKTIAAIAAEKGVEVQTVIDAQVSEIKEKLNEQLAAGEITQEQYDAKLAAAVEHATKHVNGELPMRGMGGPGGKGPRGERGGAASGDQPATDPTTSATTA